MTVELVSQGSHRIATWVCACGAETSRQIETVCRSGVALYSACQTQGKSLSKFEVGELLVAYLGEAVLVHHRAPGGPTVIDFYLPRSDVGINLDSYWWHKDRVDVEARILQEPQEHYGPRSFRARGARLDTDHERFPGCVTLPAGYTAIEAAYAIVEHLVRLMPACYRPRRLTNTEESAAPRRGVTRWQHTLRQRLSPSLADEPVAASFRENVTHPGKLIEYTAPQASEVCVWACTNPDKLGHLDWSALVKARTGKNPTGCPECASPRKPRRPQPGHSAADLFRHLAREFVSTTPIRASCVISCDRVRKRGSGGNVHCRDAPAD